MLGVSASALLLKSFRAALVFWGRCSSSPHPASPLGAVTVRMGPGCPARPEGTQLWLQPPPSFTVVPVNVKCRNGGIHLSRSASVSCDPETQEPPLTQQVINNPLAVLPPQRLPALASPVSCPRRGEMHTRGKVRGSFPPAPAPHPHLRAWAEVA